MKYLLVLLIIFSFGLDSQAQQNKLSNLAFTYIDSTYSFPDSTSISLPDETFRTYNVSFTITDTVLSDTTGFDIVHVNCTNLKSKQIYFDGDFTYDELDSAGYISNWQVTLPLGPYSEILSGPTQVAVVIESSNGALGKIHKKTINQ